MTTIHVTIDDHAEALGVVATLLNQGYQVSIDMDIVPSFVEPDYMSRADVDTHKHLWGEDSEAQRNINRAKEREAFRQVKASMPRHELSVYGAKLAQDGSKFYVNGVEVSAAEFDREIRMRMQARDERVNESRQAINRVWCPTCRVDVEQFCRSASGKPYPDTFVHIGRIREMHTADAAVPADD